MCSTVSIIIPCYNGAPVINRSIESIYIQDYPNIEMIVVDDGSTDSSKEIIASWESRFAEKGSVLKYVYQENRGLGGAIDTGLKHVTGQYLTLLDADDYYLPGSVSKKAKYLDEHSECVGVRSNGWMVRGEQKELFITSDEEKSITNLFDGLLFGKTNNWAGSYMVRTDILFAFYPDRTIYPSRFGQNMQILLPVAYKRKFGFIDEPLMVYVMHANSHSQAESTNAQWEKDDRNFYGYLDIYRHMVRSIVQDPKERDFYENRLNSWLYRHECEKAVRQQDHGKLRTNLDGLIATGWATLNDRITFYSVLNPWKTIMYKVIRRLRKRRDA